MRKLTFVILLIASAFNSFAQNQDVNPYMGMWYADHSNYRMYGADVLTRTTRAAAEARTNVIKGDHCYDTLTQEILLYNGSAWVALAESGGGTLDQSYDFGGAGAGREIVADNGAVKVTGTDGLLVTGTYGSGATAEISGAGTRMFFNPKKAAFRAGYIDGTQWNDANVGNYSVAFGSSTTASSEYSFAFGEGATASGQGSAAFGESALASGDPSFAIGASTTASGANSFASGESSTASGETSTAMGSASTASGDNSTAFSGATASGLNSTAMGLNNSAKSFSEFATGMFNTDYTPTATGSWIYNDRLFVVGNGTADLSRSDALVMLKNGNTGLGTSTPDTTLHVVGQIKYVDGNQGEYKYLTSDANGNASWGPDGCFTGWESITDNTNSYAITGGDTVTIAIQRDVVINSQLPCGIDSLWNMTDSTIIGRNGDALNISLDWTATQNTNTATEFKWWVNIGGAVGAIYPTTYDQNKGNGVEKQYNKTTTVYTLNTWEANGGKIQFTADQNITISDVRINIFRIHKAR